MIKYDKLFTLLESEGKSSTYWLRSNGMHPAVVNKMRKNERINTDTIDRLCALLNCQPGDILEYDGSEQDERARTDKADN